jgi:hypothetical protein
MDGKYTNKVRTKVCALHKMRQANATATQNRTV